MVHVKPHRILYVALAAALVASAAGCAAPAAQQPAEQKAAPAPSLYERVGGVNNIAMLIDDVVDRSYASPVFMASARIHQAHMRFPKPIYKYQATAFACMAMGGPCQYTGRTPKEAHKDLGITEVEWRELVRIFRESMTSFQVPAREQGEVLALIESAKADVVVPAPRSASK